MWRRRRLGIGAAGEPRDKLEISQLLTYRTTQLVSCLQLFDQQSLTLSGPASLYTSLDSIFAN
ncbi:MAG: hypothetical protein ABSC19_20775 [Syntrophorhabdales bacterium]|jgi:hypothetical protein